MEHRDCADRVDAGRQRIQPLFVDGRVLRRRSLPPVMAEAGAPHPLPWREAGLGGAYTLDGSDEVAADDERERGQRGWVPP